VADPTLTNLGGGQIEKKKKKKLGEAKLKENKNYG